MDRRGNGHSSFKSDQRDVRDGCRTAEMRDLGREPFRNRQSKEVVFTTLHLLPWAQEKQWRPTPGILPNLLTGQQAHNSRVSAEVRKVSADVVITKNKH